MEGSPAQKLEKLQFEYAILKDARKTAVRLGPGLGLQLRC